MNRPEREFQQSMNHWHKTAVQSEHFGQYIAGGFCLFGAGVVTEIIQVMALNASFFEDEFSNLDTLGWWTNLGLGIATIFGISFLVHKLMKWISGDALDRLFALAGAVALLVALAATWVIADGTTPNSGGQMSTDVGQAVVGAGKFLATLLRSPLVLLMTLVSAYGVLVVEKGYLMRAVHQHALRAMKSIEEAFKVLDDALLTEQSRQRRKAAMKREKTRYFAQAFSMHEHTRMDAAIALARGTSMGGKGFMDDIEDGLNQGWASFDPQMRDLAETLSTKDIDLHLVAGEIGNLPNEDKQRLIDHAAAHKRRFSERRILKSLTA